MSKRLDIEDLKKFDLTNYVAPKPTVPCLVCDDAVTLEMFQSNEIPRICNECKRRLLRVLYPELKEE